MQRQQAIAGGRCASTRKGREFQQQGQSSSSATCRASARRWNARTPRRSSKIQDVVLKIISDIAKDRKVNLVLQRSELVLFDQGFDVTDEVLQKLDEQLPTLTVNFVAPVAVAAPEQLGTAARRRRRRRHPRRNRRLGFGPWCAIYGRSSLLQTRRAVFARCAGGAERRAAARSGGERPDHRRCRAARNRRADRRHLSRQPEIYSRLLTSRAPAPRSSIARAGRSRAGRHGAAGRQRSPTRPMPARRRPSTRKYRRRSRSRGFRGHRCDSGRARVDCDIGANAVIEADVRLGARCRGRRQYGHRRRGRDRRRLPHRRQCDAQPLPDRRARRAASRACGSARPGSALLPIRARPVKIPQLGRVVIGDDVDIGANTTIDRGSGHDTVIGPGHDDR